MITVLYSEQLEPITCIDIPVEVRDEIERTGLGKVPVISYIGKVKKTQYMYIRPVRIVLADTVLPLFTTQQEELALIITPQFLPGQQALVQHQQRTIQQQQQQLGRQRGDQV